MPHHQHQNSITFHPSTPRGTLFTAEQVYDILFSIYDHLIFFGNFVRVWGEDISLYVRSYMVNSGGCHVVVKLFMLTEWYISENLWELEPDRGSGVCTTASLGKMTYKTFFANYLLSSTLSKLGAGNQTLGTKQR